MHDRIASSEQRIAAFLTEKLRPAIHPQRLPLDIGAWHIPGEPVPAAVALRAEYTPFAPGEAWGRPWATTWFAVSGTVPERWAGRRVEALIDLGSGPSGSAEGLVHDAHGIPLQGLHPHLPAVPVALSATGGRAVRLLVEAAANPRIEDGAARRYGDPATAGDTPLFRLGRADLAVRDEEVWQLVHDVEALHALMLALPDTLPRRHEIRTALERAVDAVDPRSVARTAAEARALLAPVLARRAHDSAHTFAAVGHAPAGPAPLWPVRESVRRSARAFSTMAQLTEEYPGLVVAAGSAQHYAWTQEHHPHVFERVRKAVADGAWAPVGGMWVEADTELAGGEALVRQLVLGRRYFRDELGTEPDGLWLPGDTGASAALPQLAALAGARWLLARRPEEARAAAPPHHTFRWEGLDGTSLLAHLAPDASDLTAHHLIGAVAGFADKGTATASLLPFGREGSGPDRAMLERARRYADLDGAPRVALRTPSAFFRAAGEQRPQAPVWRGGLDLAARAGGYTGQLRTKQGNRRCEALLHEAELWSAAAAVRHGIPYPYEELERLWKLVLLQQSRGILSGASIAWVHEEAEQTHRVVRRRLEKLVRRAVGDAEGAQVLNAAPFARREVVVRGPEARPLPGAQLLADGRSAVLAQAPALGAGPAGLPLGPLPPVTLTAEPDGGHVLDNGLLRVRVDADGLVRSAVHLPSGREAIAPGGAGNLLQLHRDEPAGPSALHLDPRGGRDLTAAQRVEAREHGPLLAAVRVVRGTGRSTVVQDLVLTAGAHALAIDTEVDWRERDMLLKAAWELDVHAEHTSAETQFGHVRRPTHDNADTGPAGREAAAHRWVHVGEHGFGVALAGDGGYGYDAARHTRGDGGTTTVLRATLLRAPHHPDPHADRGPHCVRHTLRPGADIGDALAEGYALGLPLRPGPDAPAQPPLVAVDHPDVVVETVKLADDRSGDVVVRLYESRGGRACAALTAGFPVAAVHETDLLESPIARHPGGAPLTLRPFQILTLRLTPGESRA
ncbi:alpha-mannosidase [Actinacidiphila guanduensis]|uniref:Alpha-mannosidase n=1 Tax=Actinacidiphila guanduensis TaxID=310781 RepID=A0A1H0MAK5_9ACTN|nr:glycoside hydrolase family 38 C-terminal domain-containing protein [Actinacidiphila guanduensis]SDO77150.1 alpha-mannosidase [Actinacidiphila guanduensis]